MLTIRRTIGIAAIAYCVGVSPAANAQGAISSAKTPPPKPAGLPAAVSGGGASGASISGHNTLQYAENPRDASAAKSRLDELERRVAELEKEKLAMMERANDDAAAKRLLEQRLASIERAQRDQSAANQSAGSRPGSAASTVMAPFVVRDARGKSILEVVRTPEGRAEMRLIDVNGNGRVQLVADAGRAYVQAVGKGGAAVLAIYPAGMPVVQVNNSTNVPVAELKSVDLGYGQLTLANSEGNILMLAGEAGGVGSLKMGPGGNGAAVTLGNAGKPASALVGKK